MDPEAEPHRLRRARPADLPALWRLEQDAFEPARRVSRRSLRRSIPSPYQEVWVLARRSGIAGFIVLWPRRRTWRVYNLAVDTASRGRGLGARLLRHAERRAIQARAQSLVLEVAVGAATLRRWYSAHGFATERTLIDYYATGRHAVRLRKTLAPMRG